MALAWVTAGQPAQLTGVRTTAGAGKEKGFPLESEGRPDVSSSTHTPRSSRTFMPPPTPCMPMCTPCVPTPPATRPGPSGWEAWQLTSFSGNRRWAKARPHGSPVPYGSSKARLPASMREHAAEPARFHSPWPASWGLWGNSAWPSLSLCPTRLFLVPTGGLKDTLP